MSANVIIKGFHSSVCFFLFPKFHKTSRSNFLSVGSSTEYFSWKLKSKLYSPFSIVIQIQKCNSMFFLYIFHKQYKTKTYISSTIVNYFWASHNNTARLKRQAIKNNLTFFLACSNFDWALLFTKFGNPKKIFELRK